MTKKQKDVCERIRRAVMAYQAEQKRQGMPWSLSTIAEQIGVTRAQIGHILQGRRAATPQRTLQIARVIGVPVTDLDPDFEAAAELLAVLDPDLLDWAKRLGQLSPGDQDAVKRVIASFERPAPAGP